MGKIKLESLGPIVSDKADVYVDALVVALEHPEMNNIALTGIYGSGKSSIIKTLINRIVINKETNYIKRKWKIVELFFTKKWRKKILLAENEYIEISMMDLKTIKENVGKSDEPKLSQNSENQIEAHIINQMIHQVKSSKIPLSNFKSKERPNFIVIFILSIYLTVIAYHFIPDQYKIGSGFFTKVMENLYIKRIPFDILSPLLLVLSILYLIFNSLSYFTNMVRLAKIKAFDIEVEISQKNDQSLFNKYLDDIIYVIESSGVKLIIFEDIDRYEHQDLFVKLRDLNILVNRSMKSRIRANIQGIKFLYLIKDDIFDTDSRTKIFDVIIPIMPIMSIDNTYDYLIQFKKKYSESLQVEDNILYGLSTYVEDLRLLKNIINEFHIYDRLLISEKINYERDQLLGMMFYKNLYPKDYSKLLNGSGYIDKLFEWIHKERILRLESTQSRLDIETFEKLDHATVLEVLDILNIDLNSFYQKNKTNDLFDSPNLIHYLVSSGIIKQENYRDYISVFYEESITKKDKDYLVDILNKEDPVFDRSIDSPTILIRRIPENYFSQKNFLNFTLVQKLFENNNMNAITERFSSSNIINFEGFFIDYIRRGINTENLVKQIMKNNSLLVEEMLNDMDESYLDVIKEILSIDNILDFKVLLLPERKTLDGIDVFKRSNVIKLLTTNFEINQIMWKESNDITYIHKETEITDKIIKTPLNIDKDSIFYKNLRELDAEFKVIYDLDNASLMSHIYNKSLYVANFKNVVVILKYLQKGDVIEDFDVSSLFSFIMKSEQEILIAHIKKNLPFFLNDYIESNDEYFDNDEDEILTVLNNSELNIESKTKYIEKSLVLISDIMDIESPSLRKVLLTNEKIVNNTSNIFNIIKDRNFTIDENLLSFISNPNNVQHYNFDDSINLSDLDTKKINQVIIFSNELDLDVYDELLKTTTATYDRFSFSTLDEPHITKAIDHGIVEMSNYNRNHIESYYPSLQKYFILGNFRTFFNRVLEEKNITEMELEVILNSLEIDVEDKISLLDSTRKETIITEKYSDELNEYLFNRFKSLTYVEKFIDIYDLLGENTKSLILAYYAEEIKKGSPIYMNVSIALDLMMNGLDYENTIKYLSQFIEEMSDKQIIDLCKNSEYEGLRRLTDSRRKMFTHATQDTEVVFKSLEKRGLISSYSKNGYYFYGNKSKRSKERISKLLSS